MNKVLLATAAFALVAAAVPSYAQQATTSLSYSPKLPK
jgi:hypothetical protein